VLSVEELGDMEQPASIRGRDGGVSGRFQGRSVWVYGDTVATLRGTYPNTVAQQHDVVDERPRRLGRD
jgi:hypothetical protein